MEVDGRMWSLWTTTGVTLLYLYFVLWAGPKAMASRKPFSLKPLLILYNVFMVFYCSTWVYKILSTDGLLTYVYNTYCTCSSGQENKRFDSLLSDLGRYYFYSKIVDLFDTVFFVLRKKDNQVSFLHVYHHTSMVFMTWHNVTFERGSINLFVMGVNTTVHVVMYLYYFLSALGPTARKFLFWKKYVTVLQLSSFVIMLAYMVATFVQNCDLTKRTFVISALADISFLALFLNFFRHSYRSKQQIKSQ